jgi:transcriptional regulator GlxA family with amidase domain
MTKDVQNLPNIALVAYDGAQMSAILGLGDLFDVANRFASDVDMPAIKWEILYPDRFPRDQAFSAIILPPNLVAARGAGDFKLHAWIGQQHRAGTIICSACAGAFWLGHAGILDGRALTTHWALEREFTAAFPKAILHPEHLLIDDNDIITAGGVMAWIDLGIHLIKQQFGPEIVSKTCRQMLIDPSGRQQRHYQSFTPVLSHNDDTMREIQLWMAGHVADLIKVSALARLFAISERTLQRRFANATGYPIGQYVQNLRVEKAKGLLERTAMPVSEICWRVGYSDVSAFSRVFKEVSGLKAGEYRKRFSISE